MVPIDRRYHVQPVQLIREVVKDVGNSGFDPIQFAVNVDTGELPLVGGTIEEEVDKVETEKQAEQKVINSVSHGAPLG